jgi:MarR family transcriptional regulator, organic hydroperoxide resistance regulator
MKSTERLAVCSAPPRLEQLCAEEDRDARERAVLRQLRVVFRAIQEHSRWVERRCGVSAAQLWAMWELSARPGLRVSQLSRALSIQQSTASNLLDKLEDKALIARRRGGADQRVVRLYLTAQGEQLLERAPRPAQGALMEALHALPESTLAELTSGLDRLAAAMDVDDEAGLRPISDD